jgi:hypothetical protein
LFWRKKTDAGTSREAAFADFERAKQATRYAAFMCIALQNTDDENFRENLTNLFQICRSHAVLTGTAIGHSATQVDEIIASLSDGDGAYLKSASDEQISAFISEAGEFLNGFLAKVPAPPRRHA